MANKSDTGIESQCSGGCVAMKTTGPQLNSNIF